MLVSDIRLVTGADHCQLQASVNSDALDEPFLLWYRFPPDYQRFIRPESGNPFVSALLLPAMRAGEALVIRAPVSRRLLRSTREIQKIYRSWDSGLSEIAIEAPDATGSTPGIRPGCHTGLFISLGVDSSYSLVKNVRDHPGDEETISHLLHVHGLDICVRSDDNRILREIRDNVQVMANKFGKQLVVIDTNIRDIMDRFVDWSLLGHGAGLASIGHALEAGFRGICIAAGPTYQNPHPCGSHPMLDPLWSTEDLSFCYDGAEARRMAKIEVLAQWPVTLGTLRVCFRDPPEEYNCGSCWKCVATTIRLDLIGALQQCRTLPQRIDLERVRNVRADPMLEASSYKNLLDEVRSAGGDPCLVAQLESRLDEALARRPASVAEIDRLQAEAALLGPLRAELARLRAGLKEQATWAKQSAQEVTRRDAIIRELQRQLQEQTVWAMRSAEEVRARDGMIRELQEQLRGQTAWAQRSAEAVSERDAIIRGLHAQLAGREAADDPAESRPMVRRPG